VLDLVHAAFPPPAATELAGAALWQGRALDDAEAAARERLHSLAAEAATLGIRVEPIIIDRPVPDALIDHIQESGTDLIVMTTHARSRLEHLLLGSVAASVIRHSNVPVLLVRPDEGLPAIASPVTVERVLVPLDGSAFAREILPPVSELAILMQAELTLLSVLQPVVALATATLDTGPNLLMPLSNAPSSEGLAPSLSDLDRAAESLKSATDLVVRTAVVAHGRPAQAIVDYAEHHGMDLIAMTTHGRGALKRLVAGSVSEAVIRTFGRPMLVVRPNIS